MRSIKEPKREVYVNLLAETKNVLARNGKTIDDIVWVGTRSFRISVDDFLRLANIRYDNGYGVQEIAYDFLVVGKDWWLERETYDGAENWKFCTMPKRPIKQGQVKSLIITGEDGGWCSLFDIDNGHNLIRLDCDGQTEDIPNGKETHHA